MKKVEFISLIVVLGTIMLQCFSIPFSGLLNIVCTTQLVVIFLIQGTMGRSILSAKELALENAYYQYNRLRYRLAYSGLILMSIGFIGIWQFWPFPPAIMLSGIAISLVTLLLELKAKGRSRRGISATLFNRLMICTVVAILFSITPKAELVAIKYFRIPEYVELYQKLLLDPDNKELQQKLEEAEHRR